MNPPIQVFPDFATSMFHRQISETVANFNMPWALRPSTMYPGYIPPASAPQSYEAPQFIHPIYDDFRPVSNLSTLVDTISWLLSVKHNIYTGKIHRSKINLNTPAPHIPDGGHYMPHIDTSIPHIVALYYINDSDGDTLFFQDKDGAFEEFMHVTPQANTMVCFDGSIFHAAQPPRKSPIRLAINTVYLQDEKEIEIQT